MKLKIAKSISITLEEFSSLPKEQATEIAVQAIKEFGLSSDIHNGDVRIFSGTYTIESTEFGEFISLLLQNWVGVRLTSVLFEKDELGLLLEWK